MMSAGLTAERPLSAHPTRMAAGEFNLAVHGARGLFSLLVVVHHVLSSPRPVYPAFETGFGRMVMDACAYGVELFFCISGFVIIGALRRSRTPLDFLRDRVARLGPLLWTTVLFMAVLGLTFRVNRFADHDTLYMLAMLPANLMALPGIFPIFMFHEPAWSLSYEMAFYTFCAAAIWLDGRLGRFAAVLWIPVAAMLLVEFTRAIPFLAGVLVAMGVTERLRPMARVPGLWLLVFMVSWTAVETSDPRGLFLHQVTVLDWLEDRRLPLALLAFASITLAFRGIVDGAGWLGVVLRTKPMLFLGTISFSLYMWHGIAMGFGRRMVPFLVANPVDSLSAQILFPIISIMVALPISVVSHRLLEVRATAWVRQRLRAVNGSSTAIIAPAMHAITPHVPLPRDGIETDRGGGKRNETE